MSKCNKIIYQGITYPSERVMCKKLDFNYNTYLYRKRKGLLLEEIFNTPINNGNEITYQGITYPNEKEMCKALKFNYSTYKNRKRKGWSMNKILNTPVGKSNDNPIIYQGIIYSNEKAMCKALDFSYSAYCHRKRKGLVLEEIFNTPINNGNEITYQGITYSNEKTMCKALNFPYKTYKSRKNQGKSLKEIFNTPVSSEKNSNQITYQGVTYSSEKEMCKKFNISYSLYSNRKHYGWSLEEIFNTPINNGNEITYQGIIYPNETVMCKALNFSYSTYKNRRRKGWSLKDALTIPTNMSLGEFRIKKSLEYRQIKYKYNKTLKTIFKEFKLNVSWEDFLDVLYDDLKLKGITTWSKETIGKLKPDFILYKDENNKIIGIIEFDGEQHFGLIEHFFKTIQQFIYRCDCDTVKNKFFEFISLPLLRIRYDQVDLIEPILDDFLAHPEEYIFKKHNPYLTEEEYWEELYDTFKKINDDNLGYNPS